VSLGDDIAAELPALRREAEALMVDSCTITRAGSGGSTIDENTGAVIPGRRFGRYVVLLGDVNFIQFSTPSTVESGAFLPLVSRS